MFKNYEEYKAQREELLNQAQQILEQGNQEAFDEATRKVTELDNQYEDFKVNQANLNALAGQAKPQVDINSFMNKASFENDFSNDLEYRKAFMNYVVKGVPIAANLQNVDATTKTGEVGTVIPTTIMEKIIDKMEAVGMILPLVTRTNYKGGLSIPTSSVKPTATWVAEGAGSDKQKKTTGQVTFTYHKLRCAVAVSLEVDTVSLAVFETTLANNVAEAMTKALEQAIISGTGSGQPKGILKETAAGNVEIAASADPTYQTLVDAEGLLPLAYEGGAKWFMTKQTFMKFIGMVDSQKQPIARVNYGINGKPERTLLGREVILNDYMTSLGATIESDTVVAFLFNPQDYVLNTNLAMTVKHYEDNDNDDLVTKAIMLVDGKVVDNNSLITVTKKSS